MHTIYYMTRILFTPGYYIGRFLYHNAKKAANIPTLLTILFLLFEYFHTNYVGVGSMIGYAFIYAIVGGFAIMIIHACSFMIAGVVEILAQVLCEIFQWACTGEGREFTDYRTPPKQERKAERTEKAGSHSDGMRDDSMYADPLPEEIEELFRDITRDRDYSMCFDPNKK